MKRFFFHLNGAVAFRDIFGTMLANAEAARAHALRRWRDIQRNYPGESVSVTVADERGQELFEVDSEPTREKARGSWVSKALPASPARRMVGIGDAPDLQGRQFGAKRVDLPDNPQRRTRPT